jgi:hypothetical protein
VLGMDWLELHNPMVCDWVGKKLAFEEAWKCVTLQGMLPGDPSAMSAISAEQLLKWEKGNDIWAVALLHAVDQEPPTQQAVQLWEWRHCYKNMLECFRNQNLCHHTDLLIMLSHYCLGWLQ